LLTGEDNTMLGHLAQLKTPVVSSRRNVQAAACHQASMASLRPHQMRCSTSTASSSRQQGKHVQSSVLHSPYSSSRHHVMLAALGNGTNGNGKPAADEGKADAQYGFLVDPPCMHGRCRLIYMERVLLLSFVTALMPSSSCHAQVRVAACVVTSDSNEHWHTNSTISHQTSVSSAKRLCCT
jgi:hypothetical protein